MIKLYIKNKKSNLLFFRDVQNFHTNVSAWMVEMDSAVTQKSLMEDLNNKCVIFIKVC
jgi:hypothetical protein